jgi:hypothetical protein
MPLLLSLSRLIDGVSVLIGRLATWMILAATLISAGNAIVRKLFNIGSNNFLEIQWYLQRCSCRVGAAFLCNSRPAGELMPAMRPAWCCEGWRGQQSPKPPEDDLMKVLLDSMKY